MTDLAIGHEVSFGAVVLPWWN